MPAKILLDKDFAKQKLKCKKVLEDFFKNESFIVNGRGCFGCGFDNSLVRYLENKGNNDWLMYGDSQGPVLGRLPDKVLNDFAHKGRIFESKKGKINVEIHYAPYSVRYHEAHYV